MPDVSDPSAQYGRFDEARDGAIAELAAAQHGVVATWQLKQLGYGMTAIRRRVQAGRLHRLYRGVYAVGHLKLTLRGRWMAAVLACGPNAVLSHRSAAELWDLRPASGGAVEVSVGRGARAGQRGIRVHNVRSLADEDCTVIDGIPVTSVYRTLLDYAEVARYQQLRLALEAAVRRDLLDGRKLDDLLVRSRGRHGLKPLRAAVAELRGSPPWTQSELENRFLALVREAEIPEPQTNVVVAGVLVDCFWREQRLVVELDGYRFHKSRQKFEQDRQNDIRLQLAGLRVMRVTQPRVEREPRRLKAEVLAMLSAGGSGSAKASGR